MFKSLSADNGTWTKHSSYSYYPYSTEGVKISLSNAKYTVSASGDTLLCYLIGSQINKDSIYISSYRIYESRYSYFFDGTLYMRDIRDDNYVKVVITGEFPLAVNDNTNSSKSKWVVYDNNDHSLTVATDSHASQIICYDLLGRIQTLDYLFDGIDNTKIYSTHRLKKGLYMITDGKRVDKFVAIQ